MAKRKELFAASFGEGSLILLVALIGWAAHQPFVFASLGPTAYELIEKPQSRSARAYNIIVGHLLGLGMGFLALAIFHAWSAPKVVQTGTVAPERLGAVVIAAALTALVTLLLGAAQPAALSTTLLVALGAMQTARDAVAIIVGVLIVTAAGELIRHYRLKPSPAPSTA